MFTDSSSLRRKEKHQRPPGAEPPVELVVLTQPRFFPFVRTEPGLFQLRFSQRLQINKMLQASSLLPANASQLGGHGLSVVAPVIATGEIHRATVEVNSDWLRIPAVGTQHVREEIGSLHLKSAGQTRRLAESLRVFPGQGQAAKAGQRRTHPRVGSSGQRAILQV